MLKPNGIGRSTFNAICAKVILCFGSNCVGSVEFDYNIITNEISFTALFLIMILGLFSLPAPLSSGCGGPHRIDILYADRFLLWFGAMVFSRAHIMHNSNARLIETCSNQIDTHTHTDHSNWY